MSDVDVLVDLNGPTGPFGLSDLKHLLEETLGVREVDLVTREGLHPALGNPVLQELVHVF